MLSQTFLRNVTAAMLLATSIATNAKLLPDKPPPKTESKPGADSQLPDPCKKKPGLPQCKIKQMPSK